MQLKQTFAFTSLLAGSILVGSTVPAQAFSFTTNASPNNAPKGDVILQSIELDSGKIIDEFVLITGAEILSNDYNDGPSEADGGASSDQGDNVTDGVSEENPDASDIVSSLNNLNLNSIIDTEDGKTNSDTRGSFEMNLFFDSRVSQVYLWERGMNSILGVQAIDEDGNVIGDFLELGASVLYDPGQYAWDYAGFDIDTKEIQESQPVGSIGLDLSDLGVSTHIAGLRVISDSAKGYNGPDFKIVGASVPEPTAVIGLSVVAGAMALSRRRKASRQA